MAERVERRLMMEFLDLYYPEWVRLKNQRVGPIVPPGQPGQVISFEEKYAKGFRRYADVILVKGDDVIIVEFDVRASQEGPASLEHYANLLPQTPELQDLTTKTISKLYVVAFSDPQIEQICKNKGIEYKVFTPEWIKGYWSKRSPPTA